MSVAAKLKPKRLKSQAKAERNWRKRKLKAGLCNRCGKNKRRKERKTCMKCAVRRQNERAAKQPTRAALLEQLYGALCDLQSEPGCWCHADPITEHTEACEQAQKVEALYRKVVVS